MKFRFLTMAATFAVALAAPALAHHSLAAEYDQTTLVTLKGAVSEIKWLNPHAAITIAITNPDGSIRNVAVEIAPPGVLTRKGIDKTTLKIGEAVTFEVWMPKDPRATSHAAGRTLTLSDGRQLDIADSLMWQGVNAPAPTPTR